MRNILLRILAVAFVIVDVAISRSISERDEVYIPPGKTPYCYIDGRLLSYNILIYNIIIIVYLVDRHLCCTYIYLVKYCKYI